jgi:hypothetical protein
VTLAIDHDPRASQSSSVGGNQLGCTTTITAAETMPDPPARPASLCADHRAGETHPGAVGASPTLTAGQAPRETQRLRVCASRLAVADPPYGTHLPFGCGNPLSDDHGFRATQGSRVVADLPSDHTATETHRHRVGGDL